MDKIKYNCLNRVIPKDYVKNTLKNNEKPIKEVFKYNIDKVSRFNSELLKAKIREFGKGNRSVIDLTDELIAVIEKYQGLEH